MKPIITLFAFFGILFAQAAESDIPHFSMEVDTQAIRLGEPLNIVLRAKLSHDQAYQWPGFSRWKKEKWELIKADTVQKIKHKEYLELVQRYIVTSFDTGFQVLKPLTLYLGENDSLQTEPLLVEVQWVMIEEGREMFDIKSNLKVYRPWYWWLGLISIILLTLFLLWMLWKYIQQRQIAKEEAQYIDPYADALVKLDTLERSNLWKEEKYALFFLELTVILRTYVERVYQKPALEATLDQLKAITASLPLDATMQSRMSVFWENAELIKYARQKPEFSDPSPYLDLSRNFLAVIKPAEEESEEENG